MLKYAEVLRWRRSPVRGLIGEHVCQKCSLYNNIMRWTYNILKSIHGTDCTLSELIEVRNLMI